jgi:hypothetical protein
MEHSISKTLSDAFKYKESHDSSCNERAPSTIALYSRQIKQIHSKLFPNESLDNFEWLADHSKVLGAIDSLPIKELTKHTFIVPFCILAKYLGSGFEDARSACERFGSAKKPTLQERELCRQSKREEVNWISYEQIEDKRDELDERILATIIPKFIAKDALTFEDKLLLVDHLLLCLYTYLPPVRNDYGACHILYLEQETKNKKPGDVNVCYIDDDLSKWKFVISTHKTVNSMGIKTFKIPKLLANVIKRSICLLPRLYLIPRRSYIVFDDKETDNLSLTLNEIGMRHFNVKLSSGLLRHVYHTEVSKKLSETEFEKACYIMGHSTKTARDLYERRYTSHGKSLHG